MWEDLFWRGNRFLDLFQVLLVSSPTFDSLGFWQKLDYGNRGGSRQSKRFLRFLFTRIGGLESILCLLLNNLTMVWKQCCESDRGEWVSGVGSPIRGTGTPLLVYTVHWVVCTAPNYSLPKPMPMPIAYATGGVHCTLHRTTFYLSVPNPTFLPNSMPYSLSPHCTMSKCTSHTDDWEQCFWTLEQSEGK